MELLDGAPAGECCIARCITWSVAITAALPTNELFIYAASPGA